MGAAVTPIMEPFQTNSREVEAKTAPRASKYATCFRRTLVRLKRIDKANRDRCIECFRRTLVRLKRHTAAPRGSSVTVSDELS